MTVAVADVLLGVCTYLASQSYVTSLVTDATGHVNIYRPVLPREQDASMPKASVIVRAAGGYQMFGKDWMPVADPRIYLVCFGSTMQESMAVATACTYAMKALTQGNYGGVTLYWAQIVGGPLQSFEPETLWPEVDVLCQVMYAETTSS